MADPSTEQEAAIARVEADKIAKLPVPKITNPNDLTKAKQQLQELLRVKRNIDSKRLSITRQHRLVITETDSLFKGPIDTLKEAREPLEAAIAEFTASYKAKNI